MATDEDVGVYDTGGGSQQKEHEQEGKYGYRYYR